MYTVLLPIDRNEARASAQAEMVEGLPGASDVQVTLLHVFEGETEAEKTSPTQLVPGDRIERRFRESGIGYETESRHGDPAEQILAVADEIDADLIVLGGRKRSPLGSLLFGSVSQAVTLDATRPVVVTGEREPPADEEATEENAAG